MERLNVDLVHVAQALQACGVDCVVVGPLGLVVPAADVDVSGQVATLRAFAERGGDIRHPLHIPDGARWLRVEPLCGDGERFLIVLLPRTCQHVAAEAERLQSRRDALQELAASTAREMNDAMTIVQGRLELLLSFALDNPTSARRHASIALEHSERITAALHNLRLVGAGGLLTCSGLDLAAAIDRALRTMVDDPATVRVDIEPRGLRVVGHEPAVHGVLAGVLRAVMGAEGGSIRAGVQGDDVAIECASRASRHADVDVLPLGIVSALLDALGGRLSFTPSSVVVTLPRELEERGLIPHDAAVLALGQPSFTQAVRGFLEPDTLVWCERTGERAERYLGEPKLYAVVTELLLPDSSGLALARRLADQRPSVRALIVTHDAIRSMPGDVRHIAGPVDRVRMIRALTGAG